MEEELTLPTDPTIKFRSQRIKKPSNRQLLYETNFDEKIDSPKRKYKKKKNKKKIEKQKLKAAAKTTTNNLIISNANIKIENNQNIFICLDESFKKPEKIALKKKLGKKTSQKLLKTISDIKSLKSKRLEKEANKNLKKEKKIKFIKSTKTSKALQILKSKIKKNELKIKRKRIFNPKEHEDRKLKKIKISEQLQELREKYGEKIEKLDEPKTNQNLWEFVLKEMTEFSEYLSKRRKYFIFVSKKLTKLAQITYKNKENVTVIKKKEEEKHLMKISDNCAKMVTREFWRNIYKMTKYNDQKMLNDEKKKHQQEKLESLVSKQLQLSTKMADYLNNSNKKSTENKVEKENNNNSFDSKNVNIQEIIEFPKEEDNLESSLYINNKTLIISLNKEPDNKYSFHEIIFKDLDINEQKHSLEEIALIAETFQPIGFTLRSSDITISQPFLLKNELREYQLIGMNWLANLNQKRMNGILADEMGLGKTIQTIALLAYLAAEKGIWGPHLIVVPTSILVNWEIEFKRWCPAFKIMTYFGSPKERKLKRMGWSRINSFHVCITSYKIVIQDQKIFRRKRWYYMILDEAQHIKNFKSQTWQILLYFQTKNRLLLTGTPLQNDVCELWSLMHFLMPNIFDSQSDFKEWFSVPMQQALQKNLPISHEIIKKLHSILRPFLLRRLKKDVEKQLPTKTEYLIKCQLSRRQRYLYDEFINKENKKSTMKSEDFLGLMNILMQLRKVCNHPDLYEPRLIESPFFLINLHYYVNSLCRLNKTNKISLEGLNILENQMNFEKLDIKDYLFSLDLIPKETDKRKLFDILDQQDDCEDYSKFYQRWIHKYKEETKIRIKANMRISTDKINHRKPIYDLNLYMIPQDNKSKMIKEKFCEDMLDKIGKMKYFFNEFIFVFDKVQTKPQELVLSKFKNEYQVKLRYYLIKTNELNCIQRQKKVLESVISPFQYITIRQKLCFPNKKIAIYDSGKLNMMMELLKKLKNESHKCIIFTQMSKMLDIFEFALNIFNFTYVRLDGSTKPDIRQKIVERFNNDSKIFCFVSSTRSGGIGLNLTGADTVVFYDTDWNPAMDKQAQDRCHRIGQTKNVKIYRLISEFTVEENILLKSIQKRKLDSYIMEEGKFNTEYFVQNKVNVKDLLGPIQVGSLDGDLEDININQYQTALEKIEDPEDAIACKKAELEEKNYDIEEIDEFLKIDEQSKEVEDEDYLINFDNLPRIYKYGLAFIRFLNEEPLHLEEPEEIANEQEIVEENLENNKENIKDIKEIHEIPEEEKEDLKFLENMNESDDEKLEKNKSFDKKQSLQIYLKSKLNIRKNYYV